MVNLKNLLGVVLIGLVAFIILSYIFDALISVHAIMAGIMLVVFAYLLLYLSKEAPGKEDVIGLLAQFGMIVGISMILNFAWSGFPTIFESARTVIPDMILGFAAVMIGRIGAKMMKL